jgi:hypothetical protein
MIVTERIINALLLAVSLYPQYRLMTLNTQVPMVIPRTREDTGPTRTEMHLRGATEETTGLTTRLIMPEARLSTWPSISLHLGSELL